MSFHSLFGNWNNNKEWAWSLQIEKTGEWPKENVLVYFRQYRFYGCYSYEIWKMSLEWSCYNHHRTKSNMFPHSLLFHVQKFVGDICAIFLLFWLKTPHKTQVFPRKQVGVQHLNKLGALVLLFRSSSDFYDILEAFDHSLPPQTKLIGTWILMQSSWIYLC